MASTQVQFRAIGSLDSHLSSRIGTSLAGDINSVARRDLERYYGLLALSLPKFSEDEAMMLVDALNGLITESHSARLVWASVADGIRSDGLAEKWNVDGARLIERLRAMTAFEQMAIADAVERVWSMQESSMQERVSKVGLVRI